MPRGRKLVVRVLHYLLLGLLVQVILFVGLMLYVNRDRDNTFYLVGAELSDPDYLGKLEPDPRQKEGLYPAFGLSAHHLKPGHGLVLARCHFSGGSIAIDDEGYDKLTVWLPLGSVPTSKRQWRSPEEAVVVVSSGGSAWPDNDCSSLVSGSIALISHQDDKIEVRVEGEFQPLSGTTHQQDHCQPRHESQRFDAAPRAFDTLNAWEGAPTGSDPHEETYPQ